ncbi:MAG: Gfo/Idh/MocA family oxidoreductase [Caldilineaceae bacterium]|nr:Gfo/Idh/MocA family oxidoreductase [Caldilineaceae bacterium]
MPTDNSHPLRIGILGAAKIAPRAILAPARSTADAAVVAIAARDSQRGSAFAQRHQIPCVHTSYADLIADPDIDAIYNPLPNSLHAEWSIRALEAGKHVLCEKPIASNAAQAAEMAAVAQRTGKVLMEAFHYRYHPLMARILAILQSGELGTIRHIETVMCIPLYRYWDIRWRHELGGGALMDVGCYTIHLLRTLAGAEPTVTQARAWLRSPQVDRAVDAHFTFATGSTGRIYCSMWSPTLLKYGAKVIGDQGELHIHNPYLPHYYHRLIVHSPAGKRSEQVEKTPTYDHQLAAFIQAVQTGTPFPTNMTDAIANMRVIDAIYEAAGLKPRGI